MMKHTFYIYAVALVLALSVAGCSKTDDVGIGDDMQQIDGIALGLGVTETSSQAVTRANVGGVIYAVNTAEDPTRTKDAQNVITGRDTWKLDFNLYNGNVTSVYAPGSFTGATTPTGGNWKPSGDLYFPNYFRPWADLWLYPDTKNKEVATNQSSEVVFLAQDLLYRPKSQLTTIAKRITVELQHQRAMINFKFGDIVRNDIDINEESVRVRLGSDVYMPYNVTKADVANNLEFMLILPETASTSAGMTIEYNTVGNAVQQSIEYKQSVVLNSNNQLGSNNCYCFTLSGKEMNISPVTIVNWVTGEPVSGEYVAVTAYPTFKGPVNSAYYFYYDNKLKNTDGTAKLQTITFNNEGECTIKTDGRTITHIFKNDSPSEADWATYELNPHIILGNAEKMYIDLTTKSIPAFNP
jgi:hypothetical protein